ncbi:MAG: hypothetical protein JO305_04695 [Alphaproteobacteria bacterium]|nr:hypothetical protein [Alphaproteobacteria bacterium]
MKKRTASKFGGRKIIAAAIAAVAMIAASAGPAPAQSRQGGAFMSGAPRVVTLSALPTNARPGAIIAGAQTPVGPYNNMSASEYIARKTPRAGSGNSQAANPMTPDPSVTFFGNAETTCGNQNPADTALAVGDGQNPSVEVNEQCLSVFSSSGTLLYGPVSLYTFAGIPTANAVNYPRALYDWYNHRFVIAFRDSDLKSNSYYDVAVSETDDPTKTWYLYRFHTVPHSVINQFVRLGQDRQGVYLASNLFLLENGCCGSFLSEEWVFLPKSELYAGQSSHMWMQSPPVVNGVLTDSTQPANVWSPYDNPRAEFMVTSYNINSGGGSCASGCNGLIVWAVSNPFGFINGGPNPEVSEVTIATANNYQLPPSAEEPNYRTNYMIDTGDTRISGGVVYGSRSLYAALTTADPQGAPTSDIVIYRIDPALNPNDNNNCTGSYTDFCPQIIHAELTNESVFNNGQSVFYPAPQPDLEGNVVTVFSTSGSVLSPTVGYVGQRATQMPGTFNDVGYNYPDGNERAFENFYWGGYNAVAPVGVLYKPGIGSVPATPGVAVAGQYVSSPTTWGTVIMYTLYTAANQP